MLVKVLIVDLMLKSQKTFKQIGLFLPVLQVILPQE